LENAAIKRATFFDVPLDTTPENSALVVGGACT
jgi:hypothetical protein